MEQSVSRLGTMTQWTTCQALYEHKLRENQEREGDGWLRKSRNKSVPIAHFHRGLKAMYSTSPLSDLCLMN